MAWLTPEELFMIKCMRSFQAWMEAMGANENNSPKMRIPEVTVEPSTENSYYRRKGKHNVTRKYGKNNRAVRPKDDFYFHQKK